MIPKHGKRACVALSPPPYTLDPGEDPTGGGRVSLSPPYGSAQVMRSLLYVIDQTVAAPVVPGLGRHVLSNAKEAHAYSFDGVCGGDARPGHMAPSTRHTKRTATLAGAALTTGDVHALRG